MSNVEHFFMCLLAIYIDIFFGEMFVIVVVALYLVFLIKYFD